MRRALLRDGGDKVMAQVLMVVPIHGPEAVLVAVDLVLDSGRPSAEHVLNVFPRGCAGAAPPRSKLPARERGPARRSPERLRPLRTEVSHGGSHRRPQAAAAVRNGRLFCRKPEQAPPAKSHHLRDAARPTGGRSRPTGHCARSAIRCTSRGSLHRDSAGFDFEQSKVDRRQIMTFAATTFTEKAENIVLIGGTGTGKTHLATALGVEAVTHGKRVRFYSTVDLVNTFGEGEGHWPGGTARAPAHASGSRDPRRTGLPAVLTGRRRAAVPPARSCTSTPASSSPPTCCSRSGPRSLAIRR